MKAACVQLLLWALCLVALAERQPKARVRCSVECKSFSKPLPEKLIRSYRVTEPACKKHGTIFTTVRSREICADSNEDWVKRIKTKLDGNKTTVMPPRAATSAEELGSVERHVGLLPKPGVICQCLPCSTNTAWIVPKAKCSCCLCPANLWDGGQHCEQTKDAVRTCYQVMVPCPSGVTNS